MVLRPDRREGELIGCRQTLVSLGPVALGVAPYLDRSCATLEQDKLVPVNSRAMDAVWNQLREEERNASK